MGLMNRVTLLTILLAGGLAGERLAATPALAADTATHSGPIAPFRFDHRNYLPGIVVADTASCKKQCEKDRQKC